MWEMANGIIKLELGSSLGLWKKFRQKLNPNLEQKNWTGLQQKYGLA